MKKQLSGVAALLTFGIVLGTPVAHADIFDSSHTYGAVTIDLAVTDVVSGADHDYLWTYTVHNNGFGNGPGQNGFSGFELYLPTGIPEIEAITPGSAPWIVDGFSGHPVEWDIQNSGGNGILVGASGVFSFMTDPRSVAVNDQGWYHTWVNDSQVNIIDTPGMNVPLVPGLQPVPETGRTLILLGLSCLSLVGITFLGRYEKSVRA